MLNLALTRKSLKRLLEDGSKFINHSLIPVPTEILVLTTCYRRVSRGREFDLKMNFMGYSKAEQNYWYTVVKNPTIMILGTSQQEMS